MSPLHIQPRPSVLLFKWLLRFLQSMNAQTASRSIAALTEISKYSLDVYARLDQELGSSFGFERKGLLMVSQTTEGAADTKREMNLVAEHGISGKYLSESEIKALEPALTGPLQGGVYFQKRPMQNPLAKSSGL